MASKQKSEIFAWNARYRIGIASVDKQHKKLVGLINALARMQVELAHPAELLEVFEELTNYTVYHFRTEEELMDRYEIDAQFTASHKAAHASFIKQATEARNAARDNPGEVSTRTLGFLSRWLIFHILGTDKRMANEIFALEKGLPPKEARLQAMANMADTNEILLDAMNQLYEGLASRTHDYLEANVRLREEIEVNRRTEHELRKLSLVVKHSPASIIITDANGVFEYVNPRFVQVTGYSLDDLKGLTPAVLKSGETPAATYIELWSTIRSGQTWFGEFQNRKKNGELYWDETSITPIVDSDGRVTNYLGIQEDITAKKLAQQDLHRSHAQLAESLADLQHQTRDLTLLNQMNELLQTCLTSDEAYRVVAHMAERLELGVGGSLAVASGQDHTLRTVARWGRGAAMTESFPFESCWAIRRGQRHEVPDPAGGLGCSHFHERPVQPYVCLPLVVLGETFGLLHIDASPKCEEARRARLLQLSVTVGEALKLALSNIRLREALREQATRDALTGLYNRRYLEEALPREILRAARERVPLALAMIDIDHFKEFNDQYGHDAGDRALVEVGTAVCRSLRQTDIACRYGGEEIAVVMPASSAQDAARRMEGFAATLKTLALFSGDNALPPVTVSVGVAALPDDGADHETLLHAADQALYAAKRAGRNRVCTAE